MEQFLHTYNRGTEKRKIFLDDSDYIRAVHDLYEFNDVNEVFNIGYRADLSGIYGSSTSIDKVGILAKMMSKHKKPGEPLIDRFAWVLMPNHYHFFQRARIQGGVAKFQQKWGTGYTNYFNIKYDRSGALFQGRYKKVMVTNDIQAAHLVCYIHANPLDSWRANWKTEGISSEDISRAIKFLNDKKNRWSSHQDYWGIKNFPSLISREFLDGFFKGEEGYRRYFINWLKRYQKNVAALKGLTID